MVNIKNIFQSHFSQEILGGLLGMLIAIAVYFLSSSLQFSSMKGLLVDSSAKVSLGSGEVRVNDTTMDPEALRRLAARATQLSKQLETTDQSSSSVAVADHSDRTAWLQMRANQRAIAAKFDLAATHTAAQPIAVAAQPPVAATQEASEVPAADSMAESDTIPMQTNTHLPDSGPLLNITLLAALGGACAIRRKSLIAAFEAAN